MSTLGQHFVAPCEDHADVLAPRVMAVLRFDENEPWRWDHHYHPQHQLMWGPRGTVMVETERQNWHVPPTLGLWIPAGTAHAVVGVRPSTVYCVYLAADGCPIHWTTVTAVAVGSFLREVIVRLDGSDLTPDERTRTEAVLYDALRPVQATRNDVPLPADDRLRVITDALLVDPADDRSLFAWSIEVGASVRTLARLFVAETGMTFAQWRLQVRIRRAVARLADGASVAEVARSVGYRTSSAFVFAFRRATGETPGAFHAGRDRAALG